MKVLIKIISRDDLGLEDMGIQTNSDDTTYLYFKPERLSAFWVAPEKDCINIVVDSCEYTTPYTEHYLNQFKNLIE